MGMAGVQRSAAPTKEDNADTNRGILLKLCRGQTNA